VPENNDVSDASTVDSSSASNLRSKQKMQRQKSRRSINAGQRRDLGTVNNTSKLEKGSDKEKSEKSLVGGFVGSISSIFFGRKGGLL
jgi:hypothetical protein